MAYTGTKDCGCTHCNDKPAGCYRCGGEIVEKTLHVTRTVELPDHGKHGEKEPRRYMRVPYELKRCVNGCVTDNAPHMSADHTCPGCDQWKTAYGRN
jgi:hypothetical protein